MQALQCQSSASAKCTEQLSLGVWPASVPVEEQAAGGRGRWVSAAALPSTAPDALAEPPSKNSSTGRRWCRVLKSCPGNEGMSAGAS